MNAERTYRNKVNGAIGVYHPDVARAFPNLEEVSEDATSTPAPVATEQVEPTLVDARGDEPTPTEPAADKPARSTSRKGR